MTASAILACQKYPVTTIIGLEVHVQLKTQTKLFCGCTTEFGAPPNTQVCPVCLGMPGALPVMNREAIALSVKTGLALNCDIPPLTKWDRKQYFYPDLPKGYQISQFDLPICADGHLAISTDDGETERRIGLVRAHLEEDAGKSMHDEASGISDTKIDLNRCGTPLLEIVSQPDLRSADEAKAYLSELKLLLTHLKVSDCEMQEGSLRVDANVNLHIDVEGKKIATPIVEIKNLNSFRNVQRAIDYEVQRQLVDWEENRQTIDDAPKTTRGWDDSAEQTFAQREKEESADYRYFPDPDLLPVRLPREYVESIAESLGELPAVTRERLQTQHGIKPYDADVIVNQGPDVIEYFETAVGASGDGRRTSSWMMQDVMRTMKERSIDIDTFPIPAERLGELIHMIADGKLDNNRARDVFEHLLTHDESIEQATKSLGIEAVDDDALESLCKELLAANPQVVEDVKGGKQQAVGALIGQAKKKNPNASPQAVRQLLIDLIAKM
ncbi:Asp-tRNA(Asn)/Glu-tRNA(Gln) amidotransferase subunit GatB [Rhodopirellula baltica]|uniref:Aspartyl/glutamyl-tRNA(Asn/Gln) amidotransferase subunit B n=1 Tax=Rhodopirellula baltica WH47 TaxID=991778 RepID=F2AU56_RHOBT|nr:Asp-tRNA(Asn)/Glu-tRNA(Gln) amidotransferase subunit GatB [Rhodopirellula baltica]EGF26847.1 aspartyl/glutamyl-tRNA amidotransferase subunit B [Rhodopirellula baltica WH47]